MSKTYTPSDLGKLGEDGFVELKNKKGKTSKGEVYDQVRVVKHVGDELVKVVKEKQDGTSVVQFAKTNRVDVVDTQSIKTTEEPIVDWD